MAPTSTQHTRLFLLHPRALHQSVSGRKTEGDTRVTPYMPKSGTWLGVQVFTVHQEPKHSRFRASLVTSQCSGENTHLLPFAVRVGRLSWQVKCIRFPRPRQKQSHCTQQCSQAHHGEPNLPRYTEARCPALQEKRIRSKAMKPRYAVGGRPGGCFDRTDKLPHPRAFHCSLRCPLRPRRNDTRGPAANARIQLKVRAQAIEAWHRHSLWLGEETKPLATAYWKLF